MSQLKIANINAGRLLETRTLEGIEKLSSQVNRAPDVLCIQDFPHREMPLLKSFPYAVFMPMTNHLIHGIRTPVGIVIASRYSMTNITNDVYWGDGTFKDLQGVDDKNSRYLGEASDPLVESTEDRLLICATVRKDDVEYDIATTHGMWTRGGKTTEVQRESMADCCDLLVQQSICREGLVLIGDLNFGRGTNREIYDMFTRRLKDCVPAEIETTLDPNHPAVKKFSLKTVSDYIMTCSDANGEECFGIEDVKMHPGISDHMMLTASIIKL